ncbi:MAG: penicillin-binding protein [Clostridiales bacterium]|nr:penicillin-binding protein [Clostridiales bacterium]
MWLLTGICLVLTVVFWFLMNQSEVEYEEVTVMVTDTSTREVVNTNTQNRTTFYEVKVEYNGQEYELHNVHGLAGYYKGKTVKALLSNNKLYANEEGIKSTSPIAIVYFAFLFGTFGMLIASATYMSKVKAKKKEAN